MRSNTDRKPSRLAPVLAALGTILVVFILVGTMLWAFLSAGGADTIAVGVMALFGNLTLGWRKLIISLVLAIVVKLLLDLYFRTKSGLLLRAVGDNGTLVTTLAQNKGNMKILGVVISNALVALCGSVLCQEQRSYSAVMGIGQVVFGLATVIIGISLIRFFTSSKAAQGLRKVKGLRFLATPQGTTAVLLGSILYKFCIQIAINAGLPANMLKFITAVLFLLVLVLAGRKGEEIIHA